MRKIVPVTGGVEVAGSNPDPVSKCIIVVPDNRDDDAARLADVLGVKDQLAQYGHLEETTFDRFLADRKLPAA